MAAKRQLLVVQVAALGWDLVQREAPSLPAARAFDFQPLEPVFPALTCPVQASFRTEALPCFHGVLLNGFYARHLHRTFFWDQSAAFVYGRRIWDSFRKRGGRVGMLFWQQSLGEEIDLILSPRPIHRHHGGIVPDCYSQPHDLYAELVRELGRPFPLSAYWGPLASRKSSDWIVEALCNLLGRGDAAPDLLLAYLPHLDYDLQRHGPDGPKARAALRETLSMLGALRDEVLARGGDFLFYGDYAMGPASGGALYPNRVLRDAGLFTVRVVKGREYPDFYTSRAVAVADHEVGGVYARDAAAAERARDALRAAGGFEEVLDREAQRASGIDDPDGPELFLVAEPGRWLAYPWWTDARRAPDYAAHIDIHNKPGYDPCELFFGFPPPRVSFDTSLVRGTHGRAGPGRSTAWTTSMHFDRQPRHLMGLAKACQDILESPA